METRFTATASLTWAVFRFAQPENKILRKWASPTVAIEWWTTAKRVTSATFRTWGQDRHSFGQCFRGVEVEARENPSTLR